MSDAYGDDDRYEGLSDSERQMEEDLDREMHKQGVTREDFPDGVDYDAFIDVDSYDWFMYFKKTTLSFEDINNFT